MSKVDSRILKHCENFVVVDKPYDMKINSDDSQESTVERLLQLRGIRCSDTNHSKALKHSYYWVHRLDHATSGVLCVGLTKQAARIAQRAFEHRRVKKYYIALVRGHVDFDRICGSTCGEVNVCDGEEAVCSSLEITASLIRDRTTDFPYLFTTCPSASGRSPANRSSQITPQYNSNKVCCGGSSNKVPFSDSSDKVPSISSSNKIPPIDSSNGVPSSDSSDKAPLSESSDKVLSAKTRVYLLETGHYDEEECSKLLLAPVTGRSHQLRVHCKHIGHIIVGDYTYSNREDTTPNRMMLHSYSLHIPGSPLPDIDVSTPDPFPPDSRWSPHTVHRRAEHLLKYLNSSTDS